MKTERKLIVSTDLNDWAARVMERTTGTTIPHDLVELELRKIADEKRANHRFHRKSSEPG